jgi:hypothetical protein
MSTTILEPLVAESSGAILVHFKNENAEPVVPKEAAWTLFDKAGNVINYRKNVAISPLSSTSQIVLTRLDLKPDTTQKKGVAQERILRVKSVYDSITMGTDLPLIGELHFFVENPVVILHEIVSESPSASVSPSASGSPSPSVSPSVSPSASASPSV